MCIAAVLSQYFKFLENISLGALSYLLHKGQMVPVKTYGITKMIHGTEQDHSERQLNIYPLFYSGNLVSCMVSPAIFLYVLKQLIKF